MLRTRKEKTRGADVEEEVELEQVQLHVQEEEEVAEVLFRAQLGSEQPMATARCMATAARNPLAAHREVEKRNGAAAGRKEWVS
jgi:hypothetical protein